jgi:regulator of protease activity HflC (stomatin/prohibitin superfamily)
MLLLKYLLLTAGFGLFAGAIAVIAYDVYSSIQYRRLLAAGAGVATPRPHAVRLRLAGKLATIAWLPLLLSLCIVVVPSGMAGIRVSQFSGARPGSLYPGLHFVLPLVDWVTLYDTRERVFTMAAAEDPKKKVEVLKAQAKEGLPLGIAVSVRYRLDSRRLDFIHSNLPPELDEVLVAPVVSSIFRQVVPTFTVLEVYSTRREDIRKIASDAITERLAADGVLVREVMIRDIVLPAEYAKGLEDLLLKEQENQQLLVEIDIKKKELRTAELSAEADKIRQVKQAEASAQAKVLDSRAELERRKLLAEADANRIRVTAAADSERLHLEAIVLKQNPLLIQKIIAERLSDKLQIMMVPSDGKFFFANDVFRSAFAGAKATESDEEDAPPDPPAPRRPNGNSYGNGGSNGTRRPPQ